MRIKKTLCTYEIWDGEKTKCCEWMCMETEKKKWEWECDSDSEGMANGDGANRNERMKIAFALCSYYAIYICEWLKREKHSKKS